MESRGRSSETSLRLCSRAPRTTSRSATALSALPADVVNPGHGTPGHAIRGHGQFRAARDARARPPVLPVQPGTLTVYCALVAAGRPPAGPRAARQAVHIAGVREARCPAVSAQPLAVTVAVQPEPAPPALAGQAGGRRD